MPTYAYRCARCDEEFDVVQSFSEKSLTKHDVCGGPVRKLFKPTGVLFKGPGFYVTDSRKPEKSGASGGSGKSDTPAKSESGASKNKGSASG